MTRRDHIAQGWAYFTQWRQRFLFADDPESDRFLDYLYLLHPTAVLQNECCLPGSLSKHVKVGALELYFALQAARFGDVQHNGAAFPAMVKQILRFQSRMMAPRAYGLWFWDLEHSGEIDAADPLEEDFYVPIFCDDLDLFHFGDAAHAMPFDQVLIRHPTGSWSKRDAKALVKAASFELERSGFNAAFEPRIDGQHLFLTMETDSSYRAAHNGRVTALQAVSLHLHRLRTQITVG